MDNTKTNKFTITVVERSPKDLMGNGPAVPALVDFLKTKRLNVNLVHHIAYGDKYSIEKLDGRTTLTLPRRWPRLCKALSIMLFNLVYSFKSAGKSNVVLVNGGSTFLYLPVVIGTKLRRKPVCFYCIDLEPHKAPDWLYSSIRKQSTMILALSRWLEEQNQKYGCKKVVYAPPFINTKLFQFNAAARDRMRTELGVKNSDVVLGYVGTLAHNAGVHVLVEAVGKLKTKYNNIRLLILGLKQSDTDNSLSTLINNLSLDGTIKLVNPLPHEKVPQFLSSCDIVVSPKLDCDITRASIPMKVMEYLAMGLPVVCSAVGEAANIITDKENGFLVRPGDVDDLVRVLDDIISNPQQAKEVGSRARQGIIQEFDAEIVGNTIIEALYSITEKR